MTESDRLLALTPSLRCDLACDHCFEKGKTEKEDIIDPGLVNRILGEAQANGFKRVLIHGGEPFLFRKDLLPQMIQQITSRDLDVIIHSNGSWGKDRDEAELTLTTMQELANNNNKHIYISLSVDKYHQQQLSIEAIGNIITTYRLGEFPNVSLIIGSFLGEDEQLAKLGQACQERDVYLVKETVVENYLNFMYPALQEELYPYNSDTHKELLTLLELPQDTPYHSVTGLFAVTIESETGIVAVVDSLADKQSYILLVPKKDFFMELRLGSIARDNEHGEFSLDGVNQTELIVIDPKGIAYPSVTMNEKQGIPVNDKPLFQIIYEVGNSAR